MNDRWSASDPPQAISRPWLAVGSLTWRECLRFVRQRHRLFGALGQPALFWLWFGFGLGPSFRAPGGDAQPGYFEYFFPGSLVLVLLFTAIFSTISIIEDRREGFLQGVLVAPAPRWAMVLGKVLGGSLIALAQSLVFLALGLTLPLSFSVASLAALTVFLFLLAIALTSLGFVIAWRMDSTQGFHAIMNVFLMPMWLLSGAFFPTAGALGWVSAANPLTYGVAGVRRLLYSSSSAVGPLLPSLAICWTITAAFALVGLAAAWRIAGSRTTGDLQ